LISYDMLYDPRGDHLKISNLSVALKNNKWINLTGDINKISSQQEFNLIITESKIVLSDIYPYYVGFTGDKKTKFGGILSLFPMKITGNSSHNNIDGKVNLNNFFYKNPEINTSIQQLNLAYSIKKTNKDISLNAGIYIPFVSLGLGMDKLGANGISIDVDMLAYNDFQRLEVRDLKLKVFNPESKQPALDFALKGDIKLAPEFSGTDLSGKVNISKFTFKKENFSDGIKNKYMASLPFKKPVDLNLDLKFALSENITKADIVMLVKVPDYDLNDLRLDTDFMQDKKAQKIRLNKFSLGSSSMGVKIGAAGWIETKTILSDSDVRIAVEANFPKMKTVYGHWDLSGRFNFDFAMKGDLKTGKTSGNIRIKDLYVKNRESLLSVEDLNMDFPFDYKFMSGPVESRIAADKVQLIENENFKDKDNFTIKSIKARHPVRNMEFEYAKDFSAALFFRNNAFEITKMKMYVLNGPVYGRDILFYLADMPSTRSFKNVEYRLALDVSNVDMGKIDNPDRISKSNAELSLNARFSGKGLDMFLGKGKDKGKELNTKGFISINKIGGKIANRLFKGLNEEKGKSKIGVAQVVLDNTMIIRGFDYNLDIGLMDVKVSLGRKALGYAVLVDDIKITRMPIQVYLNNIFRRNNDEEVLY
jgi:hypothetical protein